MDGDPAPRSQSDEDSASEYDAFAELAKQLLTVGKKQLDSARSQEREHKA